MPIKDKKKRNAYMKDYMKEHRKMEREAIKIARQMGFDTRVKRTQKSKRKAGKQRR